MGIEFQGDYVGTPKYSEPVAGVGFDAKCLSCHNFSEEDGSTLAGPRIIAEWIFALPFETVMDRVRQHQLQRPEEGTEHNIVVRRVDIGIIRDSLYPSAN